MLKSSGDATNCWINVLLLESLGLHVSPPSVDLYILDVLLPPKRLLLVHTNTSSSLSGLIIILETYAKLLSLEVDSNRFQLLPLSVLFQIPVPAISGKLPIPPVMYKCFPLIDYGGIVSGRNGTGHFHPAFAVPGDRQGSRYCPATISHNMQSQPV